MVYFRRLISVLRMTGGAFSVLRYHCRILQNAMTTRTEDELHTEENRYFAEKGSDFLKVYQNARSACRKW